MEVKFNNLKQLIEKFSDEKICRQYLEQMLWNGIPTCPKCGHKEAYKLGDGKTYKCKNKDCHKKFTVTVGTVFENTNIKLSIWFAAMYLCTAHKKGISSLQLSRDLSITQKTAWFLNHRIRKMMKEKAPFLLRSVTQVDETSVSGESRFRHANKKKQEMVKGRLITLRNQTAVIGAYDKEAGVRTSVIDAVTGKNTSEFIQNNVEKSSIVITDADSAYRKVGKQYDHYTVNHKQGQWINNGFHTNGIENFWSMLKRGIYGIYHSVSVQHLSRYCEEFCFRYNNRKMTDAERFAITFQNANGHMTYKNLISSSK